MNATLRSLATLRPLLTLLVALSLGLTATAQQNWRWANSLPASIAWKNVAYGAGLYVAVGADATIATSPDGNTWTIRRNSTANLALNAVTFATAASSPSASGIPPRLEPA